MMRIKINEAFPCQKQATHLMSLILTKSGMTQEAFDYALGEKMKLEEIFIYALADCGELIRQGKLKEAQAIGAHICAIIQFVQSGNRR